MNEQEMKMDLQPEEARVSPAPEPVIAPEEARSATEQVSAPAQEEPIFAEEAPKAEEAASATEAAPTEEIPKTEEAAPVTEAEPKAAYYDAPRTPYRWDYQNYAELERKNRRRRNIGGKIALGVTLVVIVVLIIASVSMWKDYLGGGNGLPSEGSSESSSLGNESSVAPEISIGQSQEDGSGSLGADVPTEYLSVSAIASKVRPSIVGVCSYVDEYPFAPIGEGSGIIATSDGYIVTNQHVIDGADGIVVVLENGERYEAKVIGQDSYTDLAVVKIEATNLPAAKFGDPEEMYVGDYVVAIGNPGGMDFAGSVTMGIVSALDRQIQTGSGIPMSCIQTDAAINPGNSGGALVNTKGEVIGINSSKIVATGYENMGFAISMTDAQPILNQLMKNGKVTDRVYLGVSVQEVDQWTARVYGVPVGLVVVEIDEQSPAYQAGLRAGDILVSLDDVQLEFVTDLTQLLSYYYTPGDTATFQVYRADKLEAGKSITVQVKLAQAK